MISFILAYPSLSVIVVLIIALVVVLIVASKKNTVLKLGPFTISSNNNVRKVSVQSHSNSNTQHLDQIYRQIGIDKIKEITIKYTEQIESLRNGNLFLQMKYVEEKLIDIRKVVCWAYADCLKLRLEPDVNPKMHPDYQLFKIIVNSLLYSKLKDVLKRSFIENHLLEHSDLEYESYMKQKIDLVLFTMSEYLDQNYIDSKFLVNREELNKMTDIKIQDIVMVCRQIFANARNIAGVSHDRIIQLNQNMTSEINVYAGLTNSQEK